MRDQMTDSEWQKIYEMSQDRNLYHHLISSLFPTVHGQDTARISLDTNSLLGYLRIFWGYLWIFICVLGYRRIFLGYLWIFSGLLGYLGIIHRYLWIVNDGVGYLWIFQCA